MATRGRKYGSVVKMVDGWAILKAQQHYYSLNLTKRQVQPIVRFLIPKHLSPVHIKDLYAAKLINGVLHIKAVKVQV